MYFNTEHKQNLLRIDDTFARLDDILANDDMLFEFTYTVSQTQVIKRKALTVNVSVFTRTVKSMPILGTSQVGKINTKNLMHSILSQVPDKKSAIKNQEDYVIATRTSDITAKINNEIVGKLAAGVPAAKIHPMYRSSLKLVSAGSLKKDNDTKPVLHLLAHPSVIATHDIVSSSIVEDTRKLMFDMTTRQGVDPSTIADMTHRSVPAIDSFAGTLRPSKALEVAFSPAARLLNSRIIDSSTLDKEQTSVDVIDEELMHVVVTEPVDNVDMNVQVLIPFSKKTLSSKDPTSVFVKFELIDSQTSSAIDTVIKQLDVMNHVKLFHTPVKPPIVKLTKGEISTHVNLEIKQVDPGATAVDVYKRTISRVSSEQDTYTLVGTYDVRSSEQSLLIQVDAAKNSTFLYRVIPVGHGVQGFEYTNVVATAERYAPIKSIAISTAATETGVTLEATNIPTSVLAIQFISKNLTIFENDYHNVSEPILIDDSIRSADHVTLVDSDARSGYIYEYAARLFYKSGTTEISGNSIADFVQPRQGKVDTRVTDLIISHDTEPNVTFSVNTETVDSNIDIVKTLLEKQNMLDQFKDDVTREREFLKSLIAHRVHRVDLTSGIREDFGVITGATFSDSDLRKTNAVQPLKYGHKYRYEVSALLRAPETMFETLRKVRTDPSTKKLYEFNPAKFLHPLALTNGTIVTPAGLKTRYAKAPMEHGFVGTTESIDVSFDESSARIIDATASRFDKSLNIVSWKMQGSVDTVDHFLVMKDVHNVKTIVGKAHSEFEHGNCQFLHRITARDEGPTTYVITPVFNDYKTGEPATTNVIVI
jgi:hypothetical protein